MKNMAGFKFPIADISSRKSISHHAPHPIKLQEQRNRYPILTHN